MKTPYAVTLACVIAASAHAQDSNIGNRGPTPAQIDTRLSYTQNNQGMYSVTQNTIPKVWGNRAFVLANIPYKHVHAPTTEATGLGDVTIIGGPRFAHTGKNSLSVLTFVGATLPTGDRNRKLGNDRTDIKLGAYSTFMTGDKSYDLNGVLEKTWTQNNHANAPEEIVGGLLVGKKIGSCRTGLGTSTVRNTNDASSYALREQFRCDHPSKRYHGEIIIVNDVQANRMPKSTTLTGILRVNLGRIQ
jgi:hypothetical protein